MIDKKDMFLQFSCDEIEDDWKYLFNDSEAYYYIRKLRTGVFQLGKK